MAAFDALHNSWCYYERETFAFYLRKVFLISFIKEVIVIRHTGKAVIHRCRHSDITPWPYFREWPSINTHYIIQPKSSMSWLNAVCPNQRCSVCSYELCIRQVVGCVSGSARALKMAARVAWLEWKCVAVIRHQYEAQTVRFWMPRRSLLCISPP